MSSFQPDDPCINALHAMRVEERLHIVSTERLEDNVIAYTLTDGPRITDKTAILVCRRDLDQEEVEEDPEAEGLDETAVEELEALDPAADDSADDASGDEAAE